MKKQRQHRVTLGFWSSLYRKTLFQKNYERYIKNVEKFWRGKLDGEEEENYKTFWFPVEEIQTVINGDRTRLNIFIYLLLFDFILLARSLRQILVELQCFCFFQTLTSAVLLLLYVTSMPTAPILVDRISAPARQDTTAMEKLAEVGENNQ